MNYVRTFFVCAGLLGLALLVTRPAGAAWPTDPNVNVPVCTAQTHQCTPAIVSDGAGGAIVAWRDSPDSSSIYAQRISAAGAPQWTSNGVALCAATGDNTTYPAIVSDGAGGVIVAWDDYRNGAPNIFAQRISAAGMIQWIANGVALCTDTDGQRNPRIVSDGAGGAIVIWEDRRGAPAIYAQRISADGTVQWAVDGVVLCTSFGFETANPTITSDGAGGAIVAWGDGRLGKCNIYAQRISAAGMVQWTADGVALCTAAASPEFGALYCPIVGTDGTGGAIVTWVDQRNGYRDIYAQRISAAGLVQWTADGVALCTATGYVNRQYPSIVSDGAGGAVVAWWDYRTGYAEVYAQRISAVGAVQWSPEGIWTANGINSLPLYGEDRPPFIAPDGAGGAIVTWRDSRIVISTDIYAQRIMADGTLEWESNGVALCTATGSQYSSTIVADGVGGAIVTWTDERNGNWDIYAQSVKANGELGSVLSVPGDASLAFALDPVRPNPSRGGTLTVHFTLPSAVPARLELLDVAGRRIASHEVGAGQHTFDLGAGQHLAPGLYLVRLTQGANARTTRVAVLQ